MTESDLKLIPQEEAFLDDIVSREPILIKMKEHPGVYDVIKTIFKLGIYYERKRNHFALRKLEELRKHDADSI